MDDKSIVELYWQRSETAVTETALKYGRYLHGISMRILENAADAEECVNDTYSAAWRSIPPRRPSILSAFLGRITRRISIDLWRRYSADKRGGGETALAIDELSECVSGGDTAENAFERRQLRRALNTFLASLPQTERQVFVRRYWGMEPVSEIAAQFHSSESRIKSMLSRSRKKLRIYLKKESFE